MLCAINDYEVKTFSFKIVSDYDLKKIKYKNINTQKKNK